MSLGGIGFGKAESSRESSWGRDQLQQRTEGKNEEAVCLRSDLDLWCDKYKLTALPPLCETRYFCDHFP